MFQIDWKLKSYIYRILYFFKLDKTLFFIQKKITKRSKVKIGEIKFYWSNHLQYLKNFNSEKILEFGAGKSLEQNIYFSYIFNNRIKQTVIDINKMIDFTLVLYGIFIHF